MRNFNFSLDEFEKLVYNHLVSPPGRFEGQPLFETSSGVVEAAYIEGTNLKPKVKLAITNMYVELLKAMP